MFKEQHQEALAEFKGAWKLAKDLPHAVQEEQEDRCLLTKLAVGVGRLGAALLELVTRLGWKIKRGERGHEEKCKNHIHHDIKMLKGN